MESLNKGLPSELKFFEQDCEKVVNNKLKISKYKIISYNLFPLQHISGFFGEHLHIKIKLNHENIIKEAVCFAKFFPRPHLQVDFELVSGAFKKEIFIYSVLMKKFRNAGVSLLNSITPECYYVKPNSVLVFEDLILKGYQPLPRYKYLDYDHVIIIIKALAKLHASSLIFEEKQSSLETYFTDYGETFYVEKENHKGFLSFIAAINALYTEIDIFDLESKFVSKQDLKIKIQKACYKIFDLVKPSKKYRNVICHGDLWSTNIMLKYNNFLPTDCMFIDFQIARYAPPAHDVMGFLYITTSTDFRNQYIQEICDVYYCELDKIITEYGYDLNSLINRDVFNESCEEYKLFGAVQTATYYQMIQVKSDYMEEVVKDKKKWAHTLYEDRSTIVLENCKTDEEYKSKLEETLKNLRDICETIYL